MNPEKSTAGKRRGLGPVLLSALVFPGLGQLAQGRWLAGTVWGCLFGLTSTRFFYVAGRVIDAYYSFALNFETAEPPDVPIQQILVSLALPLVVYVANVIDTALASRRPRPSAVPPE